MASKHGGDVFSPSRKLNVKPEDILDLSSNVVERSPISAVFLNRLPPEEPAELERAIECFYGLGSGTVLANAGSSQLIKDICLIYRGCKALILSPTYTEYERFATLCGMQVEHFLADEESSFHFRLNEIKFNGFDVVFLCNPNNPTGVPIDKKELFDAIKNNGETLFIVDESYMDFDFNRNTLLREGLKNLCVLRSFSKFHGLAGLRVGWLFSPDRELVKRVSSFRVPWSLTEAAISKAKDILGDDFRKTVEHIASLKDTLILELSRFSQIKAYRSSTNFVLFKLLGVEPYGFLSYLEERGILIRNCADFRGLDGSFFRVSLKNSKALKVFLKTLKSFFSGQSG